MKLAIKNPAPTTRIRRNWGDFYFGEALKLALQARGVEVVQHFWPEWDSTDGEDVVLVLRGLRPYVPPADKLSVMWVLSHPGSVSIEEIDRFDFVYVASHTHRSAVRRQATTPVLVARQCSDFPVLTPGDPDARTGILFVGNARGGVFRDSVYWAQQCGLAPRIIGRGWEETPAKELVERTRIANRHLPELYRSARIGLNDHWIDMKYYGYVNNRTFDCLFSGLPLISDAFAELKEIFGEGILYARDETEFGEVYKGLNENYDEFLQRMWAKAREIYPHYTFDARAAQIISDIEHLPRKKPGLGIVVAGRVVAKRVRAVLNKERAASISDVVALLGEPAVRPVPSQSKLRVLLANASDPNLYAAAFPSDEALLLTAGPGVGPWEILLDRDLHQVRHQRFDIIVVERLRRSLRGPRITSDLAGALCGLVRPNGLFVVPTGLRKQLLASQNLQLIKSFAAHDVFRRVTSLAEVAPELAIDGHVALQAR